MKKLGFIVIGLVVFSCQLFAQDIENGKDPDEQIIVNKKYDDNGNLIQYDSTYVQQWSSDSTFNFAFPNDGFFQGNEFSDMDEFFKNFMDDSSFENFGSSDFFGNMPFDEDFFEHFHGGQSDSSIIRGFSYDDFERQLNEMLNNYPLYNFQMPQFRNEEQQKEWEELMKKHQKEMEDLKRKWDNN